MKRTILLADDSPTIQRLVTQTFAEGEFEIVSVSNGDAAVKKFEELRPELVLADIYMPGKNGYDVCAEMKGDPALHEIPVVMLTSSRESRDVEECYALGVNSYIVKPVDFESFVAAVSKAGLYWLLVNEPPR